MQKSVYIGARFCAALVVYAALTVPYLQMGDDSGWRTP